MTMLRKFNYTGRRRIPRSRVDIRLKPTGEFPSFDASLDFSGLDLPEDAVVLIEAYDKSSYMRFDYGTVGSLHAPPSRVLNEVQSRDTIFFRVKVVDISTRHGRVLAVADRLPPARLQEHASEKESLLGVRFSDLGEEIWHLDLTGDLPTLELNKELGSLGLREMAHSSDSFISLVLPAVVRQIFTQIVLLDGDDDFSGEGWKRLWYQYAIGMGADPEPGSTDEARAYWINDVVSAFCRRFRVKERFRDYIVGDAS